MKKSAKSVPAAKSVAKPAAAKAAPKAAPAKKAAVAPAKKKPAVAAEPPATFISAQIDIGFGNHLSLRGEGPGLSWDKGVPMQFVSIGKWGWASHEAAAPVKCKLYKNDETAALSGEVTLEPGKHVELTALF